MFVVLERRGHQTGRWFPRGANPESDDYVAWIDQAEVFKLDATPEGLCCAPPMPRSDKWEIRQIELRLK